jgi:hypothetical protein
MKFKFKTRYILGEGYPWAFGCTSTKSIGLAPRPTTFSLQELTFPVELWSPKSPKYRLILERVS